MPLPPKNALSLPTALLWLAATAPALAQGPAALQLTPAQPTAGQPLTLRYHPAGTALAGKPVGALNVTYWQGAGRPAATTKLAATASGDDWQATWQPPAGTTVFLVAPAAEAASDNNQGQGYFFPIYAGARPVAGALGTEGVVYSRAQGVRFDAGRALGLLRQEFALYPASRAPYASTYYWLLATSPAPADRAELAKELPRLRRSPQESDRLQAIEVYKTLKRAGTADSLTEATRQAFPKGSLARLARLNALYAEKDPVKQQALYEALGRDFPEAQAPATSRVLYDYARGNLAVTYAGAGQPAPALTYLYQVKNPIFQVTAYSLLAEQFLKTDQLAAARTLLEKALADHPAGQAAPAGEGPPQDPHYTYLNLYSRVLYQQKQYPEALAAARPAYEHSNKQNAGINTTYALALAANQQGAAALPLLAELLTSGKATPEVKSALQPTYVQAKGSAAGYDTYLAGLQSALHATIRAGLAKQMVDKPAPDFTLRDLDGKAVTLSALKGKVVVLDFWATWCGPCKKSFPAMQLAVQKYKNDPNVAFLFIDTWERIANPQASVAAYITESKYPFQVLLDLPDPATKRSAVVESFGIKGIPAKFVLDPEGHIRFQLVGFSGGDDAAVEELSAMIELAGRKG